MNNSGDHYEGEQYIGDADDEDRNEIIQAWETEMHDFIPDDMITFDIAAGSEEVGTNLE